jgi:hypothetical protein
MRKLSSTMKLVSIGLCVASLLAASYGFAQAPGLNGGEVFLQRPQFGPGRAGCPVVMSASQRSHPQQIETIRTGLIRPTQVLAITLFGWMTSPELTGRITSAEVVAHALSPRNRALLTLNSDDADVIRAFHLEEKAGGGFRDLQVDGVTSIRWIEVKSITYSNGTVWQESETQKCSVRPDPFVLVSSAR